MSAVPAPDLSIERFEAGDVNPDLFDHEAHVFVAWLYVRRFEQAKAIARFDAALRRLVTKLGTSGKYHATLTWFYLLLIAERARADEPWLVFKQRNYDLVADSKAVLNRYYTTEALLSDRARELFVLPDKLRTD